MEKRELFFGIIGLVIGAVFGFLFGAAKLNLILLLKIYLCGSVVSLIAVSIYNLLNLHTKMKDEKIRLADAWSKQISKKFITVSLLSLASSWLMLIVLLLEIKEKHCQSANLEPQNEDLEI